MSEFKFEPVLRQVRPDFWTATFVAPVVGPLAVEGCFAEEAQIRAWLTFQAMLKFHNDAMSNVKPVEQWGPEEFKMAFTGIAKATKGMP